MKQMKEPRDCHIRVRTTAAIAEQLDQLIEYFQKVSITNVTKTDVVEYAIKEMYQSKIKDKKDKKDK